MDMIGFKKFVLPALPGLNVGTTDVELFKDCMAIFLFCFFFGVFFWKEEIAWSTVDVWVDARHPDWCEHFCLYVFFSGHLFETTWYLRRSSHFQPSDRWRPLLDDAFAKVAANSVSCSD